MITQIAQIRLRRDTSVGLRSVNPILAQGEPSYETDTGLFKIGDGVTHYQDLGPAQQATITATVNAAINALLAGAPAALDTLNELATALGDDPNFATTVSTALAARLQKSLNLSDVTDAGTSRYNLHVPILGDCQAVATTPVTMTVPGTTFDGYTAVAGDRILLVGQSVASQNGPWIFNGAASAMTRPTDYPAGGLVKGRTCQVINGTINAGTLWSSSPTGNVTIDTTATTWTAVNANIYQARGNLSAYGIFLLEQFDRNIYTTSDGRPAFEAAVAAAIANGGGQIRWNRWWNLATPTSVLSGLAVPLEFVGVGGPVNISSQIAGIRWTGTGSATAIDATNSVGIDFRDFGLTHNVAGYTGKLLDLTGGVNHDGSGHKLRNMLIRTFANADAHAAMVKIDQAHTIDIENCWLYASRAIVGPLAPSGYSNRVRIVGGYAQGLGAPPIMNPDMAWTLDNITFEPMNGGVAGAVGHAAGSQMRSMTVSDCYFGDDTTITAGAWIDVVGGVINLSGGIATAMANGSSIIKVSGGNTRINILGGFVLTNHTGAYLVDNTGAADPTQQVFVIQHAWNQASFSPMVSLIKGTIPPNTILMDSGGNITYYGKPSFVQGISIPPSGTVNLLSASQASAETGTVDVDSNNNIASLVQSTDFALDGTHSWKFVTSAAAADTSIGTGVQAGHAAWRVPATPGVTYTGFANLYTTLAGRTCSCTIYFVDAAGAAIPGAAGSPQSTQKPLTQNAWTQTNAVTAVAPAGTVKMFLLPRVQGAAAAGEAYYADCMQLAAGLSTTWVAPGSAATGTNLNGSNSDFGGQRLSNVGAGALPNDVAVVSQIATSLTSVNSNVTGSFTVTQTAGFGRWFTHGTAAGALPAASGNTARLTFVNEDSGTALLTLTANGSDTIQVGASQQASVQLRPGDAVELLANGSTGWRIV